MLTNGTSEKPQEKGKLSQLVYQASFSFFFVLLLSDFSSEPVSSHNITQL